MSTFVFAPSWVNYPNQPKSLKETDDFPTLNIKQQHPTLKNNDNVWLNPHLIRRIHNFNDDQHNEDDEEMEEKKYQLERLKALVPKTKRSLSKYSNKSSTPCISTNKTTNPLRKAHTKNNTTTSRKSLDFQATNHNQINNKALLATTTAKATTATKATTAKATSPVSSIIQEEKKQLPPKDVISKQEQQNFIYFIKSWTSTGIIQLPQHHHVDDHQYKAYSYFDFNNNNTCSTSSFSSYYSSSNSSNESITLNDSYFYYHPFPPSL